MNQEHSLRRKVYRRSYVLANSNCNLYRIQVPNWNGRDLQSIAAAAIVVSIKTLPLINVDNTDLQEHHKSTSKHYAAPAFSASPR
jgi:hypothetical protein